MLGGSYRQTFFQMDTKSQLQPMVQLILVGITKTIDVYKHFKLTISECMYGVLSCRGWLAIPNRFFDEKIQQWIQRMLQRSSFFFWERVAFSFCSTKLNISNSFSGVHITDEWTTLHPDLMSLSLEEENKIISRMDHKGKRNVIAIYAGILRLWTDIFLHDIPQK